MNASDKKVIAHVANPLNETTLFVTFAVPAFGVNAGQTTIFHFQRFLITFRTNEKFCVHICLNFRLGIQHFVYVPGNHFIVFVFLVHAADFAKELFDYISDFRIKGMNIFAVFMITAVGIVNAAQFFQNEHRIGRFAKNSRNQTR